MLSLEAKRLKPGDQHAYAEILDQDILWANLTAESDLPMFGEPAWSHDLVVARKKVLVLQKQLSALRTGLPYHSLTSDIQLYWGPPLVIPDTYKECSHMLHVAKLDVRETVSHSFFFHWATSTSPGIRYVHARSRQNYSIHTSENPESRGAETNVSETASHSTLMCSTGSHTCGTSPPTISDPKTCQSWTQIDVPREALRLFQERNRAHFGQVHGTPFTITPFSEQLGFGGDGPVSQPILQNTCNNGGITQRASVSNHHCRRVQIQIKNLDRIHDNAALWTPFT